MSSQMEYLRNLSKRGAKTLSVLGRLHAFKKAMDSEFGQHLLGDLVNTHASLLETITKTGGTEEERVKLSVVSDLLTVWSRRLDLYESNREAFLKEVATP